MSTEKGKQFFNKSMAIGKSLASKAMEKVNELAFDDNTDNTSNENGNNSRDNNNAPIVIQPFRHSLIHESTCYNLKPLDLILFNGHDVVAGLIRKIESSWVKPNSMKPLTPMWTHAGIIIDKSILPLDCMEDGKLYIYESIFSGTVLGYTYSKVLPVDHPSSLTMKRHAGPQIRCLESVIDEAQADVGVCPLSNSEFQRLWNSGSFLQKLMMDFHQKYSEYTYPFSILPQLGAASDELYQVMNWVKNKKKDQKEDLDDDESQFYQSTTSLPVNSLSSSDSSSKKSKKKGVFCSELAALLYEHLDIIGFTKGHAARFTPVEVEAVSAFEGNTVYVKHNHQIYVKPDGKSVVYCGAQVPTFLMDKNLVNK